MLGCWQLLLLCNVVLYSRLLCTKMTGCINIYMHLCIPLYTWLPIISIWSKSIHTNYNWKFWPKQIRKFLWSLKQKQIAKFDSFWGMAPAVPLNSNLISCGKEQDSSNCNVWTTFKSNVCFQYMKMNILKKDVHPMYFCLMIPIGKGIFFMQRRSEPWSKASASSLFFWWTKPEKVPKCRIISSNTTILKFFPRFQHSSWQTEWRESMSSSPFLSRP